MIHGILQGWQPINKHFLSASADTYSKIVLAGHYNSRIHLINSGSVFKEIDGEFFVIKPHYFMGKYGLTLYFSPEGRDDIKNELLKSGVQLRITTDERQAIPPKAKLDTYGLEYLYNTEEASAMEGGDYKIHRKIDRLIQGKISLVTDINSDTIKLLNAWSSFKKAIHQKKLFRTISENRSLVDITTVYYEGKPLGFTVTEKINDRNAIGLMGIININSPDILQSVKEPNIILHQIDCKINKNMWLNNGSDLNNAGLKIAKEKLQPSKKLKVYRISSSVKITKEIYYDFTHPDRDTRLYLY